jgi:hypothetical protein
VVWHDGASLKRYQEFRQLVEAARLYEQLGPLFFDNKERMHPQASFSGNQVSGHLGYWPRDLAEEAYAKVLGVFNGALERMDAKEAHTRTQSPPLPTAKVCK